MSKTDIFDLANPGVQSLKPYAPGKPLAELEREYGITDAVKLASNENPLGTSPKVTEVMAAVVKEFHRYPDGNGFDLKVALAKKTGFDASCITLGNGSNEILELVARTFVLPDQEILFSQHSFAVYPIASQSVNAKMNIVPALACDHPISPYGHDLNAMADAINPNTRVVFVANPNNPTGTWLKTDELYAFIKRVPSNVIVVLDQAYFEYVNEPDYPDAKQWVKEFDNLVVTHTFSKAYGLPALRVGYGVSSPAIADLLNRVRQPFNTNAVAQAAALVALSDNKFVEKSVALNHQGLLALTKACDELGLGYIPSVANFMCIDVVTGTGKTADEVYEGLLKQGVIVRPVASYELPSYIRVTVGTEQENQRFIDALKVALSA